MIDRCEYLDIPVTILISRCPFRLIVHDHCLDVNVNDAFIIDTTCNEFRYSGKTDYSEWKMSTDGILNLNEANTAYNIKKNNNVAIYGRYGLNSLIRSFV